MTLRKASSRRKTSSTTARDQLLEKFDGTWKQSRLTNQLRFIHIPLPKGDARFHLALMLHTGSRKETENKAGLSHLLEHMMFRGSAQYPTFSQLSEAFENLGGDWNAATGHEYTEYYYSGTTDKAEDAFRILADFTLAPALNDLETEKRIVLRELEGELNENGVSTDVDFHVLKLIWPHVSLSYPIIGSEESIQAITQNDLKTWLQEHYHAGNMILIAVGNSYQSSLRLAKKHFAPTPPPRTPTHKEEFILPEYRGPKCLVVDNSDNEYDVQISFVCEGTNSLKTPAYDMLARILGDGFSSRLVRRVREELGLVYDISASFQQYYNGGTFNLNANISEANLEKFFQEVFSILKGLTSDTTTASELERHRNRAVTDLMLIPSDPAHSAFRIGWSILTKADPGLNSWKRRLEEISAEDLKRIAKELFSPHNLAVVALGPKSDQIDLRVRDSVAKFKI